MNRRRFVSLLAGSTAAVVVLRASSATDSNAGERATVASHEPVVVVHGLWMNGIENGVLRHRLSSVHGFAAQPFNYQSVQAGLDENVLRLNQFLAAVPGDTLHLVGHSLGGLLLLHAQQRQPDPRPGRIVCLGSPLRGSRAAQALAALPFGEDMLGATIRDAVLNGGLDAWRGQREVGVIAGTLAAGLGRVIGELPEPNDGTVAVEETRLPGITEHLEMKVSHTGLLFDDDVAAQTAQFLRHGRFSHS